MAEDRAGFLCRIVRDLAEARVGILQYRNKTGNHAEILADAKVMRAAAGPDLLLVLNDWPELLAATGFDGVHIGQTDMPAKEARAILGPDKLLGLSTHNEAQLRAADMQPVDYIAIGPVCATLTKANPDPVVGLEGVRQARTLTQKPLVAIGGITAANAPEVLHSGANSIAIISAMFIAGQSPGQLAREFLRAVESGIRIQTI